MAQDTIRQIFFSPPLAVARLGSSSTPLDSFEWVLGDPHSIAETRIQPTWSLAIQPDGSVEPHLPQALTFRDGDLLRPVAPFLELWALVGDGPDLAAVPLTPDLLQSNGASLADLTFRVTAANAKAARRAGRAALRFEAVQQVQGDNHARHQLRATNPANTASPMIPLGRFIGVGWFQVLRPSTQPANPPWPVDLRMDVVRVRFTPAHGRFYGPEAAGQPQPTNRGDFPAVAPGDDFLDPAAPWFGAPPSDRIQPWDTYDMQEASDASLGVVDDTCDARIVADLALPGRALRSHANVFVAPPHYAPDRRPFLSAADEINDRQFDPARNAAMTEAERDRWVEDLFERVFETLSLMNVDLWRQQQGIRQLPPAERGPRIANDGIPQPRQAMGGEDRLRDPNIAIGAPTAQAPLPLSKRARERHRFLSDERAIRAFVRANPDRMRELIRKPFSMESWEQRRRQSMRMPPFMNHSNPGPLSLAHWQYDLLLEWVDTVIAAGGLVLLEEPEPPIDERAEPAPLSSAAEQRREAVLRALGEKDQ